MTLDQQVLLALKSGASSTVALVQAVHEEATQVQMALRRLARAGLVTITRTGFGLTQEGKRAADASGA